MNNASQKLAQCVLSELVYQRPPSQYVVVSLHRNRIPGITNEPNEGKDTISGRLNACFQAIIIGVE